MNLKIIQVETKIIRSSLVLKDFEMQIEQVSYSELFDRSRYGNPTARLAFVEEVEPFLNYFEIATLNAIIKYCLFVDDALVFITTPVLPWDYWYFRIKANDWYSFLTSINLLEQVEVDWVNEGF